MKGGLVVCGATSEAGKSWVVTGLCRLLARRGVRVAPFKGQNMALNAAVVDGGGGEIGHAQWVQALAAGAPAEVAMNPVLLKPTGERVSQLVVMGVATGEQSAADYHATKAALRPTVLAALDDLRSRYDVVVCEGAGGAAEINLLAGDFANVPLAAAAGLPVVVVGDIERGGVFASLFGTWALLPDDLRLCVRGFVINRFRGDPTLLGDACAELERRTGVPVLGVVPAVPGTDIDAEDSLALDSWDTVGPASGAVVDVAVVRFPRIANFGDLDPLRLEPEVGVRWVRSASALGRPDLVVLPGSKNTRGDLEWFRSSGLAAAVEACGARVVAVCAGAQMIGATIADPLGAEGPPGSVDGLGWLPLRTEFGADKVLDRPGGMADGERVDGYRIHHGRVSGDIEPWIVGDDGAVLGWQEGRFRATTLHGLFESDGFRAAVLRWASPAWVPSGVDFAAARAARFDRIADALESSLDLDVLFALIDPSPMRFSARKSTPQVPFRAENGVGAVAGLASQPSTEFSEAIATGDIVFASESSAGEALGAVTGLVPHLRWRIGAAGDGDLLGADLAADPDRLAAQIRASAAGRGSDDPQVLASLWWQAYAYRVAGTTLAAWVVAGAAPDPSAPGSGVGLARSRPSSLLVDPGAELVHDLDDLVKRLFAGHLDPMMAALRARHASGLRLLHGNVAAGVASALGAVGTADGAPPLRDRVDAATAAIAHPEEPDLGRWTDWDYRRTTCCLWWKTSAADGKLCEDCSLRTGDTSAAPDRQHRHQLPGGGSQVAP